MAVADPRYAPDKLVKVEGVTLAADVSRAVIDLTYDNDVDSADMFALTLDASVLRLIDSTLFDVGKQVEIHMGYAGDLRPMMLGEITAIQPSFPSGGAPTLGVTGYDRSHRMRHNRPERFTWKFMNDSVIAAAIASENLLIPDVDPAPTPARESVQQVGSDWALLQQLAERNYFQLFVHWDRLYFRFPRRQPEIVTLEWGVSLASFTPRLSTATQIGVEVLRGYDYEIAEKIVAVLPVVAVGDDVEEIVERLGDGFLQQLVSLGRYVVRDRPVANYADAIAVARSVLLKIIEGLYEGSGSCIGMPELRAGDLVEIRGVGERFSGFYRLSKVTHRLGVGGYTTSFEVTQKHANSLLKSLRSKIDETRSPNRQQAASGLMVGIVENNVDPKGLGRVQVSIPLLSDVNLSAYARMATAMAGANTGTYFLPDLKDEVLVAFVNGNVDEPVILGGLWNGDKRPPEINADGLNAKKTIRFQSGIAIDVQEKPTPTVTLTDGKGSKLVMDAGTGDITIQAKGNVNIRSGPTGKVNLNPP
jgi:phage protein D/phage baseplate assembly protein gpV